jgi:hypothetical protein
MENASNKHAVNAKLWAGHWHNRQVVYDPTIQPSDQKYIFLYFVQGRSLCLRDRELERKTVLPIKIHWDRDDAVAQYLKWRSINGHVLKEKLSRSIMIIEEPPSSRRKCLVCDGMGHWSYAVGTFSEGGNSDGRNHRAHCEHCNGQGYFDDVFVLP